MKLHGILKNEEKEKSKENASFLGYSLQISGIFF
jgi:hypothetical protein